MTRILPRLAVTGYRAVCLVAAAIAGSLNLAAADGDVLQKVLQPVFRQSCVQCHGALGDPSGNVNLFALQSASDLIDDPELVRNLVRVLDSGIMPPGGAPPLGP